MSDEKSKNLYEQNVIKFCVKLNKMVPKMKATIDAAYESAMSEASVYGWYKFETSRMGVKLMGRPGALTAESTK